METAATYAPSPTVEGTGRMRKTPGEIRRERELRRYKNLDTDAPTREDFGKIVDMIFAAAAHPGTGRPAEIIARGTGLDMEYVTSSDPYTGLSRIDRWGISNIVDSMDQERRSVMRSAFGSRPVGWSCRGAYCGFLRDVYPARGAASVFGGSLENLAADQARYDLGPMGNALMVAAAESFVLPDGGIDEVYDDISRKAAVKTRHGAEGLLSREQLETNIDALAMLCECRVFGRVPGFTPAYAALDLGLDRGRIGCVHALLSSNPRGADPALVEELGHLTVSWHDPSPIFVNQVIDPLHENREVTSSPRRAAKFAELFQSSPNLSVAEYADEFGVGFQEAVLLRSTMLRSSVISAREASDDVAAYLRDELGFDAVTSAEALLVDTATAWTGADTIKYMSDPSRSHDRKFEFEEVR